MTAVGTTTTFSAAGWKDCEEVDYEAGVKVEVAMSARITRVETGATVWSNAVSETRPVSQRNVAGVVSQMNRTMEVAINKLPLDGSTVAGE